MKSYDGSLGRLFFYLVDQALQWCFKPQLYQIGKSWFCVQLAEIIDVFTVVSIIDMDKLGKILPHHWKERLKISRTAKFESDMS